MRRRACWILLVPLGLWCAAARAAAQDTLRVETDTTAFPPDTVRVRPPLAAGMAGCNVSGERLVADSAAAAAVLAFPQCRNARLPDLRTATLVGVHLWGDCHAHFAVDVWRSEARREYLFRLAHYDGGCRAMGRSEHRWYELPRLPPGWTVAIMNVRRGDFE
jgi:hypothetical protein